MKKTILIVSIIIVCGLAIFGIFKLTQKADNSSESSNVAASTITTEAPSTNSTVNTAPSTENKTNDSTSKDKDVAKETTSNKDTNTKGDVVISIGSASATADETIVVPLSVDTVPKNGIGSCNFNIKYDNKALEVVEITPGNITKNISSTLEFANIESTGMISYLFTSSTDGKDAITKPGIVSNIKFKVKKDAAKGKIELTNGTTGAFGDKSLNKITASFNNGQITIK